MEFKSFEDAFKVVEDNLSEKRVNKTNSKGISHANSLIASGDVIACLTLAKSYVSPSSKIFLPGKNFNE